MWVFQYLPAGAAGVEDALKSGQEQIIYRTITSMGQNSPLYISKRVIDHQLCLNVQSRETGKSIEVIQYVDVPVLAVDILALLSNANFLCNLLSLAHFVLHTQVSWQRICIIGQVFLALFLKQNLSLCFLPPPKVWACGCQRLYVTQTRHYHKIKFWCSVLLCMFSDF